jgi:hypothetical protein
MHHNKIQMTLVLLVTCFTMSAMAQKTFRVGEMFPDIELPLLSDGERSSVHDFRGEKVILQIFASW